MATLREFRKGQGWTLVELARRLGKHFTTVQKWEQGVRVPGGAAIAEIEKLTDGAVRAGSFVQASTDRAAANGKEAA